MRSQISRFLFVYVLLGASCANAFTLISNKGKPASWTSHKTSYRFNTATSGYFVGGHDASGTVSDEFDPIRRSFATWLNLPGLDLSVSETSSTTQSANSDDHINTLQWVKTGWRDLSFRPPSNALAVTLLSFDSDTGAINDADIYFNSDSFKWAVVDSPSEQDFVDVQNIATHEIGHFLGLDHSSENLFEEDLDLKDATMFYASSSGETEHRDLKSDDIKAITSLYGASSRGAPKLRSADLLSSASGTVHYSIKGSGFNEYTSFVLTKHSSSEVDVISRYRTIVSDSEATAEFDILGMSSGDAQIVAFNDPDHPVELTVSLSSTGFQATSAGDGGGGCSLQGDQEFSILFAILGFAAGLGVLSLRRLSAARVRVRSR